MSKKSEIDLTHPHQSFLGGVRKPCCCLHAVVISDTNFTDFTDEAKKKL